MTTQTQIEEIKSSLTFDVAEALERERIRLAACGVVARANTPESAEKSRAMHQDYRSASCDDVARAVDREMKYREALLNLRAMMEESKCMSVVKCIDEVLT